MDRENQTANTRLSFLQGGGQMGEFTRNYDWSKTALGTPENWPQSLCTTLGIVLHSAFPMFLFWGKENLTCFYNDAFLPSLGRNGKHPAVGKNAREVWAEIWDFVGPLVDKVLSTGEPVYFEDQLVPFYRNGQIEDMYWTFSYSPAYGDDGIVHGIFVACTETTKSVLGMKGLEISQEQLVSSFEQSPVGLAIIDKENLTFRIANSFYCELVGRKPHQIINKALMEALPELAGQGFDNLLNDVINTGNPFIAKELSVNLLRNGQLETIYVDLTYQPKRSPEGQITQVLVVATDVTQQVLSRKKVEESEARFRALIEEAPVATCLFVGPEMRVEVINARMVEAWGKDFSVKNKPLIEALPELKGQPFMDILADVYSSGKAYVATAARVDLVVDGKLGIYYYDFTYKPLLDAEGKVYAIINVSINVTDRIIAQRKLEESEAKLRNLIASAPIATCLFTGREMTIEIANEKMLGFWGKGSSVIGKELALAVPELVGQPFLEILDAVYTTGITYEDKEALCDLEVDGELRTFYFDFTYKPMFDLSGQVYGIMDMAIDVTEQVKARRELEQAEAAMRGAVELAGLATWSLDIEANTFHYSPRFMEWLGFSEDTKGLDEAYNPLPEEYRELVPTAIAQVIGGGSSGLYDYEHPIINRVTGQVRIIHAQAQLHFDGSGKPIALRGTAQDVTDQRQIQLALEAQVQQRTEELAAINEELQATNEELAATNEELAATNEELEETNGLLVHSNDELAQYAYVASHDLQEPLRKIRIFSSMLSGQKSLADESRPLLSKISQSAERMSLLIQNLLEFSRLLKSEALMNQVSLTEILKNVINDFELTIAEKGATIEMGDLPVVDAVALQMNQLFFNLLSNSLKFTAPGITPRISVTSQAISHQEAEKHIKKLLPGCNYYHIIFSDNGIGFETKYAEQIFEVFKRLHGRDIYPGSGIGLSLCRRIVMNHGGMLYADSEIGKGTSFHILLPDRQPK